MRRGLFVVGVALLLASTARAEDGDLEQTIADLNGQASDKERIDQQGVARVEISQVRGWLTDATNSVRQKTPKKARRFFDLVRSQMKLIDQLVKVAAVENEAARLEREVGAVGKQNANLRRELDEKRVKVRALRMIEK